MYKFLEIKWLFVGKNASFWELVLQPKEIKKILNCRHQPYKYCNNYNYLPAADSIISNKNHGRVPTNRHI